MRRSLQLLGTPQLDLMQIHNLLEWRTHIETLRAWKADGLIRYIGVTHYTASAHSELAAVLRTTPVDFVQINYSLEEPESAREVLPLAMDRCAGLFPEFASTILGRAFASHPVADHRHRNSFNARAKQITSHAASTPSSGINSPSPAP